MMTKVYFGSFYRLFTPACCLALLFGLGSLHLAAAADSSKTPNLRHRFQEGATNVFKLELEMKTEEGKEIQQISLISTTVAADARTATISLNTRSVPQNRSFRSPHLMNEEWNPFVTQEMYMGPQPIQCQIELDNQGQVLRSMGELRLPPPFHELFFLMFPALPEKPAKQWERKCEQAYPCVPWNINRRMPIYYSPMGPGGRNLAKMPVIRRESYRVVSARDNITQLELQLTVESLAKVQDKSRWQVNGTAMMDFDTESGQVVRFDMACTSVWTTENLTRRAQMTLLGSKLAPADIVPFLASLSPAPPAPLDEKELQKLLHKLDARDETEKIKIMNSLSSASIPSIGSETLALLREQAKLADDQVRPALTRLLVQHATGEQTPFLLGLLRSSDHSLRMEAVKSLGRLREKQAAEPLANMVAQGNMDFGAAEALKQIGSPAEDAVLSLLQEKHYETLRRACEILNRIGTQRSIEPLRALLMSADDSLANAARSAIQEIQSRSDASDR
jgi:hypothetical protein